MSETTWTHVGALAREAVAIAEIRTEYPEIHGLSTGVDAIDEWLSPVLEGGKLIVVAGETGRGKTAFAAQLALAFAHQVPVMWYSLEDDKVDTVRRVLSNAARVPVSALRGGFRTGSVPKSAYDAVERLENLPIYIDDEPQDAVKLAERAWKWSRQLPESQAPMRGAIIIDQLSHILDTPWSKEIEDRFAARGLLLPPRPRDAEHKALEWKVAWLDRLAHMLGVVIVLLHQLNDNRDDNGRPGLNSIRSGRGIVHYADAFLVPWRPRTVQNPLAGPGQPKTVPAPEDAAELICIKGRGIADGWTVKLRWDGAHQRFADLLDASTTYQAPAGFSPRALEGASKIAALREKIRLGQLPTLTPMPALPSPRFDEDIF